MLTENIWFISEFSGKFLPQAETGKLFLQELAASYIVTGHYIFANMYCIVITPSELWQMLQQQRLNASGRKKIYQQLTI